jgi:hypothetical protein
MAVRLSALNAGCPLTPGRFLVLISARSWSNLGTCNSWKNYVSCKIPPHWNSNPRPSGCSIVPQPTALSRALSNNIKFNNQEINTHRYESRSTWGESRDEPFARVRAPDCKSVPGAETQLQKPCGKAIGLKPTETGWTWQKQTAIRKRMWGRVQLIEGTLPRIVTDSECRCLHRACVAEFESSGLLHSFQHFCKYCSCHPQDEYNGQLK